MTSAFIYGVFIALATIPVIRQYRRIRRGERRALAADGGDGEIHPGQHPHIDVSRCIGCGACVTACPEGDVLGVVGGTVAKYPRQKLVMTSPVEFPMFGSFKKLTISKEELLRFWEKIHRESGLVIHAGERVEGVERDSSGIFVVRTTKRSVRARAVVLAVGRRGTPRKLGVTGEEQPHVMYSLLDAEAYRGIRGLVVGGGDSAVEAALGLAYQKGNRITLSYRRDAFTRLKARNAERIAKAARKGQVNLIFNSNPVRVQRDRVLLDVRGVRREVPADYVWVFAGSIPATELLDQAGVKMGTRDLTAEARAALAS